MSRIPLETQRLLSGDPEKQQEVTPGASESLSLRHPYWDSHHASQEVECEEVEWEELLRPQ